MPYSIAQAAARLGVHPTTIRRQIRSGKLSAELADGQWAIHDEAIAQAMERGCQAEQLAGGGRSDAYHALVSVLERQLDQKDQQIAELHVLLQAAQEQTQRMLADPKSGTRHRLWPFSRG